ncbi:titin isoform X3 [Pectinophora gossypiella]|uniref:titin isoform X3 n=1 Tax=Pectinophora gossypiella TaxID=13191 RepID=UPI00214E4E36|nr:titin isoform X3 [Pectinophora gossypiella]
MAQYTQRTQSMHRPGQTDHGHGGGLAYGGKPTAGAVVQPRAPSTPYQYPPLRLHQPGYGSAALTYRDSGYSRGGGAVGEYRGGARMSLLGNYLPPPAPPAHHPPPADPPPYKKIRIAADRAVSHHHQLRVDTREPVNTYNTVEVLSPNPPSEPTVEDQSFRTTKDELLQQISKVDREMALSESTLAKLKKKQEELEQTASKPTRAEEPEEAVPRHRSLAQCVYADNRKKVKASAAHALLAHLGPPILYPLYNQPQDTEVYHENIRKHRLFRKRLADHIRRVKLETEKREDALAEAYSRRAAEWLKRVERIEQGQKRKVKDAKNREFFEKVFPELRKQREERERFNRLGARVKSEAELEEIADGLHEQEHEDKKMRSLTVVPPLLRDPGDKRPVYIDTNRRCMDMEAEHAELELRNVWSAGEREVFREKYLQHPKNFGQIASFLPRKSVRDCVRFYYLSKKAENYKQLLRKPRQRRPPRGPRPPPEPAEVILPPGVTTRLQRSQVARAVDSKEPANEDAPAPPGAAASPAASPAGPQNINRPELIRTPPQPPSPVPAVSVPAVSAPPAAVSSSSAPAASPPAAPTPPPAPSGTEPPASASSTITTSCALASIPSPGVPPPTTTTTAASAATTATIASAATAAIAASAATAVTASSAASGASSSSTSSSWAGPGSAPPTPQPAQPPTPTQPPPTPEAAVIERISTPSSVTTSTTTTVCAPAQANCAVCNMAGATRTVSRSRAVHYGLKEDAVGARVCEPCHCRCVRSRYTRCPVPTCPGPRVRAKRLRHLPPRWHDLAIEAKRPLMEEFQIPSELSKCCLACFKRITRRLETLGEGGCEPSEEEAARFRALVRDHGTAWDRMAHAAGRTPASLKAFYFTYRKRFQLDSLVSSLAQPKGSESDSSVASSGDTDTASAESPRPPPLPGPRTDAVAPKGRRRDEYDSSATETADEENDAPTAKVIIDIIPSITLSTPVSSSGPVTPPSTGTSTGSTASTVARNGPGATLAGALGAGPQLTVRDVVLNMIEISLMKNNQPVPPPKLMPPKVTSSTAQRESLATLSVVNSSHVGVASPVSPQRPATITPLAQPPPAPDALKEGVVVLIEPRDRNEPLLDLSVKRPRLEQPSNAPQQSMVKPPYRNSTEYPPYRPQPERESPTQYNSKPKPVAAPQRPAVKPVPNPKGSITLGTPVENRFDSRRTPPDPKTGSITAGTPVHGSHHLPDKKSFDYYKRRSPGGAAYYAGVAGQPRPQSPSFSPTGGGGYTGRAYALDSRQIIMTDYITSQQMHGAARRERPERPASPQYRRDAPHQPHPHQQPHPPHPTHAPHPPPVSVIQRHTPHVYQHPHPHPHPPPGHEAFTSLVDVASAATALPVPRTEPKQDNKLPSHHQHQQHNQHPHHQDIRLQDRMARDMAMQKYHQHQQHQQMQQYQSLERDRRTQASYMERDRQIQMQQNRERERAMAAMQERHIALEHQNQLLHERHHMQHPQSSQSQETERRLVQGPAYSAAPKHRALTPLHTERKDQ